MTVDITHGVDANAVTGQHTLIAAQDHWDNRAWQASYQAFAAADTLTPLPPDMLERFGMAAYLIGQDDDFLIIFERAVGAFADQGLPLRAARCAFWLGLTLMFLGEFSRGNGWFARARRLTDDHGADCVENGYLLLPTVEQNIAAGDDAKALATAEQATQIGEEFADTELVAIARHLQGCINLRTGHLGTGFAQLDDAMLSVTGGQLSPIVTGLIYCSAIDACQRVLAYDRTREWTGALSSWCAEQPQMVAFTGRCMIHRAEILQLDGDWNAALAAANAASRLLNRPQAIGHAGTAYYHLAEVHRLQGHFSEAEAKYREASRCGRDPQPGLAIMRADQGRLQPAASAIRRALASAAAPAARIRLLPAYVDIMLQAGEADAARDGAAELARQAEQLKTDAVQAMAAQAHGAIDLAEGRALDALGPLRRAADMWQRVGACFHLARTRVLIGQAVLASGDVEGGQMELAAARGEFARLGAAHDQKRTEALLATSTLKPPDLLTPRQREILRCVALGMTNRGIGDQLGLSQRTVDRHVSNILTRLDVPSRAAATAYAYSRNLLDP